MKASAIRYNEKNGGGKPTERFLDDLCEIIVAEAYRDAQKTKGEGDAKASAIYASAFQSDPEFFAFYRSLEAYRAVEMVLKVFADAGPVDKRLDTDGGKVIGRADT